ncbi:sensor histidine kinase [Paenibacillus radicis (ex Gao et al. 2016)]|uniref:histidine kinase n=1 Tax=Paenibacillus radicis (ex Gao et al. 2016) TaxID=1737354 RepID=A0A917HNS7_9BACL|nr:HAMP domain-containing sensor histidine kinase [Paenibacillus radicis (ex Gao et al. 2016)]GGG85922.1 hypothetical protein GCM10010918_50010 [Paenibacillus radicis (ex Gao et al. 2016)]
MRLIYRLNLSFGILLFAVLAITAVLLYPLLSNTLIEGQRKEMRVAGRLYLNELQAVPGQTLEIAKLQNGSPSNGPTEPMEAIWAQSLNQLFYSQLTAAKTVEWANFFAFQKVNGVPQQTNGAYIIESISSRGFIDPNNPYSTTFMMTTPLSTIKSMQWALFSRMLLILSAGGALAFLLSMFITRKLVTPLTDLRKELKKVETRRFSEVELVKSSGEVGEVAQSVYQLAGELEKYHRAQKQFFQNASHELKTPLMSIQGYAEGIRDGIFTGEHADKGLETIAEECERLKKIVTEMILLAKLESEEGIFENFDIPVQNLITKTVERMNPLLLDKGIHIEVSSMPDWGKQPHIKVDPEKLLQALLNIVGNASRYAKETIRINVSENDNRVAIEICDDGEGISEAILPRLFQRFVKGQDGQTGLGLAISRAIVERCHGQISAHNRTNGGAAFVLSFPTSQAS